MKRDFFVLVALALVCLVSHAALAADISVPNTFTSGTPAKAEEVNQNFSTVYGAVNGINAKLTDNITNSNISPTAQIEQSKINGGPFAGQTHGHKHIIWSGGCGNNGNATGWNTYCANGVDFNTAAQYLSVNTNGTFTVVVPGFYRIKAFSVSMGTGYAYVRLMVNGSSQHSGYQYINNNEYIDNGMDLTWPLNAGDTFRVEYYNPSPSGYAFLAWNSKGEYSRLQVTYMGEQ